MELLCFLLLAYVGMIIHFLKKKMKDGSESLRAIFTYFETHVSTTIVTFLSVTVTIIVFYFQMPEELTLLSSVGLGYAGDSIMNKWDK